MTRFSSIALALCFAFSGSVANAQTDPSDQILTILRDKGYQIITQERTWLGRERVVAEKQGTRREVVFNPGTGEILRDYAYHLKPDADHGAEHGVATVASQADAPSVGVADAGSLGAEAGISLGDSLGDVVSGAAE